MNCESKCRKKKHCHPCQISLRPIVEGIDCPSVIKTGILPGNCEESLIVATLPGNIYAITENGVKLILDIEHKVMCQGIDNDGYEERGLVGCELHPKFAENGILYPLLCSKK